MSDRPHHPEPEIAIEKAPAARAASSVAQPIFPGTVGRWAGWILAVVAGSVLFVMMVITFIDVFGRKFLNTPLYGGYEITEFLMGTLIFSALPLVTSREDHVTIDVLDHLVPRPWRRWQLAVVTAISALVLGYIAWRLWLLSFDLFKNHEVTMTLHIPHGPFARVFAGMAALAALACLVNFWEHFRGRRAPRAALPTEGAA